jgi:hypothetical protein
MNLKEYQRLHVSRFEPKTEVSSFGAVLISAFIVGFALIIITIFASFALFNKLLIK